MCATKTTASAAPTTPATAHSNARPPAPGLSRATQPHPPLAGAPENTALHVMDGVARLEQPPLRVPDRGRPVQLVRAMLLEGRRQLTAGRRQGRERLVPLPRPKPRP